MGAGAVVTKNVLQNSVVGGVPAYNIRNIGVSNENIAGN